MGKKKNGHDSQSLKNVTPSNSYISVEKKRKKTDTKCNISLLPKSEKKLSVKKSKKYTRELTRDTVGIDSLNSLKATKNSNDIDNKIKSLKSELALLMGHAFKQEETMSNNKNSKEENGEAAFDDTCDFKNKTLDFSSFNLSDHLTEDCQKVRSVLSHSKTRIVEIGTKHQENNGSFEASVKNKIHQIKDISSSKSKLNFFLKSSVDLINNEIKTTNKTSEKENIRQSNFQHNVEELLYKSFLLQNVNKSFSSCDEGTSETVKSSAKKVEQQKPIRNQRKKLKKQNAGRQCPTRKRRRKCFEVTTDDSFESDSVMNLSDVSGTNTEPFYLESYDWEEPFCLQEKQSDSLFVGNDSLEIIEVNKDNTDNVCENSNSLKEKYSTPKKYSDDFYKLDDVGSTIKEQKNTNVQKIWECPICFDPSKGQEIVATVCGHIFCKKCIETYCSTKGKTCPVCRTTINGKPLITLFNI